MVDEDSNNAVIPSYLMAFALALTASKRLCGVCRPDIKSQTNETYISHSHNRSILDAIRQSLHCQFPLFFSFQLYKSR